VKEGITLQGRIYLLTYQLATHAQRLVLQLQIINPGLENVALGGTNFLVDFQSLKEYFGISDSTRFD